MPYGSKGKTHLFSEGMYCVNPRHHILFSPSAAGSLKAVLRKAGRNDRIFLCPDDFSIGPVDEMVPGERIAFFSEYLEDCPYIEDILSYFQAGDAFWHTVEHLNEPVIIWFSRLCALEYAGFLEILSWRKSCDNLFMIDVSGVPISSPGVEVPVYPKSCSECSPESLFEMLSNAKPVSAESYAAYSSEWKRLCQENGVYRIIRDGELITVPFSWCDKDLFSLVPEDWIKAARVVGEGLGRFSEDSVNVGDTFLFLRLLELQRQNRIELRAGPNWHLLEVRRKKSE